MYSLPMLSLLSAALLASSALARPPAAREYAARKMLIERLQANPEDRAAFEQLNAYSRYEDTPWLRLHYTDMIAADPRTSAAHRAEAVRQAGEMRLQLGDFPGAEKDFERALTAAPGDAGLLYLLAESKRERPEEALIDADRAAKAEGASAFERARAHLLAGQLRTDLGDAPAAQNSLELALKDAPDDLDALSAIVRVLRGRKLEAFPYAERADGAARKAPPWRRPAALLLSAGIWLEIEEHSRAAENLRDVLRFNPEDLDALGALARIKDKLTPVQRDGLRRKALVAEAEREPEAAAADEDGPNRALAANPNDLEALRLLIVLNLDRKRPAEAEAYALRFEDAVWKTPVWQRAEANRALAALWLRLGAKPRAAAILERARDIKSDAIDTWRMIIAAGDVERNAQLDGVSSGIYCTAAEMRLAFGDREGAEEEVRMSLKNDPRHPWSLRLLASLKTTASSEGLGH